MRMRREEEEEEEEEEKRKIYDAQVHLSIEEGEGEERKEKRGELKRGEQGEEKVVRLVTDSPQIQ